MQIVRTDERAEETSVEEQDDMKGDGARRRITTTKTRDDDDDDARRCCCCIISVLSHSFYFSCFLVSLLSTSVPPSCPSLLSQTHQCVCTQTHIQHPLLTLMACLLVNQTTKFINFIFLFLFFLSISYYFYSNIYILFYSTRFIQYYVHTKPR